MRISVLSALLSLGLTACLQIPGALAGGTAANFCTSETADCESIRIENQAPVTVTKVNLTQEKTDGACAKKEETISQNLSGTITGSFGEFVLAKFDRSCQYKVKFVTTSGCTGDKTAHFKVGNFPLKYNAVVLKGGCGTLKTSKTIIDSSD